MDQPPAAAAVCMDEPPAAAAVHTLLRRYGLLEHEPQLRELGATSPLHLFGLTSEDFVELDSPPLTDGCERAFAALLAAAGKHREEEGVVYAGGGAAPTEERLREALRAEDALRTSPEGQRQFREAETRDDADWLYVAAEMQQTALLRTGLRPTSENLDLLRDAALRNPELARYVRHNRCRQGQLRLGDAAPNVAVLDLTGAATRLLPTFEQSRRPVVILAGSYS